MSQKLNDVYPRDNLPNKIKDETYITNLHEYSDIGTNWVALYVKNNEITYFDSFGVEHIPKEIIRFSDRLSSSASLNKNIKTNPFRIQAYELLINLLISLIY